MLGEVRMIMVWGFAQFQDKEFQGPDVILAICLYLTEKRTGTGGSIDIYDFPLKLVPVFLIIG